jgi:hypothetical protein
MKRTTKGVATLMARSWGKYAQISRSASMQSESEYLIVSVGDECFKVRISDHELPPTYGLRDGWPDFDVFVNVPRPCAMHWSAASIAIGKTISDDWTPSRTILAAIDEQVALSALQSDRIVAERARQEASKVARDENQRLLDDHGVGHLTGASRKRKLRSLRPQVAS